MSVEVYETLDIDETFYYDFVGEPLVGVGVIETTFNSAFNDIAELHDDFDAEQISEDVME